VTVPDLTGLTPDQARKRLESKQLRLGETTGAGRVTSQDPAPGSPAAPDSTVDVALTPDPV